MRTKKDKLEMFYMYSMMGIVLSILCAFIYLLYDDSSKAKEFVFYLIFAGEIAIIIFAGLLWKLNRKNNG